MDTYEFIQASGRDFWPDEDTIQYHELIGDPRNDVLTNMIERED